jgi:hypothetical protein
MSAWVKIWKLFISHALATFGHFLLKLWCFEQLLKLLGMLKHVK